MRGMARLATAVGLVVAPLLPGVAAPAVASPAAAAAPYDIPVPPTYRNINPIKCLTIVLPGRKDRCRTSKVPSTVDDRELVDVGVGPDGTPAVVTDRQELVVHGQGAYLIYELGPARLAEGLNDFSQPTTELGQVVWQGFSTGNRTLDGLLTLDPTIEANRLPMAVKIAFARRGGGRMRLAPGGRAPADGTATITLLNVTTNPRFLFAGTAAPGPLAHALDTLLAAASSDRPPGVPPYAGAGLPAQLPGRAVSETETNVTAPLRVHGTVTVSGRTGTPVTGPGTSPTPGGATISGTLTGSVEFTADLKAGQTLALSLDVQPYVDPRTFQPPNGLPTWTAWAATHPSASEIAQATATFIGAAAQAARAADFSPYLQTDTKGAAVSTFHFELAPATATRRAGAALTAKPGAIIAACLAGLAIAGNAALLRRQW